MFIAAVKELCKRGVREDGRNILQLWNFAHNWKNKKYLNLTTKYKSLPQDLDFLPNRQEKHEPVAIWTGWLNAQNLERIGKNDINTIKNCSAGQPPWFGRACLSVRSLNARGFFNGTALLLVARNLLIRKRQPRLRAQEISQRKTSASLPRIWTPGHWFYSLLIHACGI